MPSTNLSPPPSNVNQYTSTRFTDKFITALRSGAILRHFRRKGALLISHLLAKISGVNLEVDLTKILDNQVDVVDVGASDGPSKIWNQFGDKLRLTLVDEPHLVLVEAKQTGHRNLNVFEITTTTLAGKTAGWA